MVGLAGAVVTREMSERPADELKLVLVGGSHDTGGRLIGDRNWAVGLSVAKMHGEVQTSGRHAGMLVDGDGTDGDMKR